MPYLPLFSGSSGEGSSNSMDSLKKVFTSPILYAVLGGLVLLVIVFYLIRRMIRATPNATTIIVRNNKIQKVVDENNPKYYLVPFRDRVGAIITNEDKELSSDKLYINNGPDALYKVHYTLKYKVVDPVAFYPYLNNIEDLLIFKLNDELRYYADQGNALVLIKDYRENTAIILSVINKAVAEYHVEAAQFKINLIEPMGR